MQCPVLVLKPSQCAVLPALIPPVPIAATFMADYIMCFTVLLFFSFREILIFLFLLLGSNLSEKTIAVLLSVQTPKSTYI